MTLRTAGLTIGVAAWVAAVAWSNLSAKTIVATAGTIRERVSATAIAVPVRGVAHLRATIGATAKEVLVKEGDQVRSGQLLATLDAPVLMLQAAQRQAELRAKAAALGLSRTADLVDEVQAHALEASAEDLQATLAEDRARRQEELARLGTGSPALAQQLRLEAEAARARAKASGARHLQGRGNSEVRIAHENVNVAQAEAEAAELALRQARIVSPVDGVVVSRAVDSGDVVMAGATLFEIADPTRLELRAEVDASMDLGHVRTGMPVSVCRAQQDGVLATGRVRRLGATVERRANAAGVATEVGVRAIWIDIDGSGETPLVLGSRYEVTIDVGAHPAPVVVPRSTVRVRDGVSLISVKRRLWFRDVPVQVIGADGDNLEVRGIDRGSLVRVD